MHRFCDIALETLAPVTEVDVSHENIDGRLTATTDTGCCFAGRGPDLKRSWVFVNLLDEVGFDDVYLPLESGEGAYQETMLLAV